MRGDTGAPSMRLDRFLNGGVHHSDATLAGVEPPRTSATSRTRKPDDAATAHHWKDPASQDASILPLTQGGQNRSDGCADRRPERGRTAS